MGKKQDFIDIDLSATRKKRFRVDKDNDRILELNTSDMMIISRLKEVYPKLQELALNVGGDLELEEMGDKLVEIDKEMRKYLDYIFDSNVSEVCAPDGSLYDLFDGSYRFEHIINTLGALYESNLDGELKKMEARVKKHTDKYIGK